MTVECRREISRIGRKLEQLTHATPNEKTHQAKDLLLVLGTFSITLETLQKTHIGVTVNRFRKTCRDPELVASAKNLIKNWKKLLPATVASEDGKHQEFCSRQTSCESVTSDAGDAELSCGATGIKDGDRPSTSSRDHSVRNRTNSNTTDVSARAGRSKDADHRSLGKRPATLQMSTVDKNTDQLARGAIGIKDRNKKLSLNMSHRSAISSKTRPSQCISSKKSHRQKHCSAGHKAGGSARIKDRDKISASSSKLHSGTINSRIISETTCQSSVSEKSKHQEHRYFKKTFPSKPADKQGCGATGLRDRDRVSSSSEGSHSITVDSRISSKTDRSSNCEINQNTNKQAREATDIKNKDAPSASSSTTDVKTQLLQSRKRNNKERRTSSESSFSVKHSRKDRAKSSTKSSTKSSATSSSCATTDTVRVKCTDLLWAALRDSSVSDAEEPNLHAKEVSKSIESCIYQEFKNTDSKYRCRVRSRVANLKDAKNPQLRHDVLTGTVTPQRLAVMTTDEMASSELKETRARMTQQAINDHQVPLQTGTDTDLVECEECGSKKCTYNQVQTLCADEPMTTFVLCYDCGYRFKFY